MHTFLEFNCGEFICLVIINRNPIISSRNALRSLSSLISPVYMGLNGLLRYRWVYLFIYWRSRSAGTSPIQYTIDGPSSSQCSRGGIILFVILLLLLLLLSTTPHGLMKKCAECFTRDIVPQHQQQPWWWVSAKRWWRQRRQRQGRHSRVKCIMRCASMTTLVIACAFEKLPLTCTSASLFHSPTATAYMPPPTN